MRKQTDRLCIGVSGLDEVLYGGLIPGRAYLVRGGPGTGKTTLGLHFLSTGVKHKEKTLFITLGEREHQLRANAESMGFDLKNINFLDLSPTSEFFKEVESYDIFSAAEVEREPITQKIMDRVEKTKPKRVFLDAMTQLRYLATDAFQFHKQTLSFLRYLTEKGSTVLFTSEGSKRDPDNDLQFLSDGIIHLESKDDRRSVRITKFRGADFRSGFHTLTLSKAGMQVFPAMIPSIHGKKFVLEKIPSGIPEIDELLMGGIERGTTTIITGPSGSGKTTLGMQWMKEAAGRSERSIVYLFDEVKGTLVRRCESIQIPVKTMLEKGTLSVNLVEPMKYTPTSLPK